MGLNNLTVKQDISRCYIRLWEITMGIFTFLLQLLDAAFLPQQRGQQPNKDHLSIMCVSVTQKKERRIILPLSRKGKIKSPWPVPSFSPTVGCSHLISLCFERSSTKQGRSWNRFWAQGGEGVKFKWQVVPEVVPLQCSAGSLADFARYDRVQSASGVWVNRHRELESLRYMGRLRCVLGQHSSVLGSAALLQRSSVKRQYLQMVGRIYHCYYSNIPRLKRFAMESLEFYHPVDSVFNLVSQSLEGNNRFHTIILNTIQNLLLSSKKRWAQPKKAGFEIEM